MRLFLDKNNVIVGYQSWGNSSNGIEYDGALPDYFYSNFKSSFYMLKEGLIVENPDYVAPNPPVIGPSEQNKLNAQIMLNQAKQKEDQDEFNAKILLKLVGGMK